MEYNQLKQMLDIQVRAMDDENEKGDMKSLLIFVKEAKSTIENIERCILNIIPDIESVDIVDENGFTQGHVYKIG